MNNAATKIHAEIRRCEDERYQAMLSGDVDTLDRLLDPELTYTHSSGTADTKASYIEGVRSKVWEYRDISRSDETVLVRDNVALVFSRAKISINVKGVPRQLDNRMLAVWSRPNAGAWRLLALHSTPVPQGG